MYAWLRNERKEGSLHQAIDFSYLVRAFSVKKEPAIALRFSVCVRFSRVKSLESSDLAPIAREKYYILTVNEVWS